MLNGNHHQPTDVTPVPEHPDRIPLQKQIAELKRELALRHAVYPRLIYAGKLRSDNASYRIAAHQAALVTLEAILTLRAINTDLLRPEPNDPTP